MHECILCKKDMKKSKNQFGKGCINNVYKLLNIKNSVKFNNREKELYKIIMNKVNITNIDKNQKIWLTDRYLTYKYLDKLNYGNFEELKILVDKDIKNIRNIKDIEALESEKKISLNESYNLYKKNEKFNKNLSKLKKINFDNSKKIKLILTTFSFIFNIRKNKSQYENEMFKAMQYVFWQTVIEVGGKYFDFKVAAMFLQHSLEEKPANLVITEGIVLDAIKNDVNFKKCLKDIVNKYNNKNKFSVPMGKEKGPIFKSSDLYFAINKSDIAIDGIKNNDGTWNLKINIEDKYDYTDFKNFVKYYLDTNNVTKSIFSSTLYNLAYFSVKFGVMKEYTTNIIFEIKDYNMENYYEKK